MHIVLNFAIHFRVKLLKRLCPGIVGTTLPALDALIVFTKNQDKCKVLKVVC